MAIVSIIGLIFAFFQNKVSSFNTIFQYFIPSDYQNVLMEATGETTFPILITTIFSSCVITTCVSKIRGKLVREEGKKQEIIRLVVESIFVVVINIWIGEFVYNNLAIIDIDASGKGSILAKIGLIKVNNMYIDWIIESILYILFFLFFILVISHVLPSFVILVLACYLLQGILVKLNITHISPVFLSVVTYMIVEKTGSMTDGLECIFNAEKDKIRIHKVS